MKLCIDCGHKPRNDGEEFCCYCGSPLYSEEKAEKKVREYIKISNKETNPDWIKTFQEDAERLLRYLGYEPVGDAPSIKWQKPSAEGVKVFYL